MRKTIPLLSVLFAAAFLFGATTAAPAVAKKKKKPVATKKSSPTSNLKKTTTSARRTPARKAAVQKPPLQSWRYTQRAPTPDRYKEIQQALASKGYLEPSAPSGVWDTSSVAALKKFQQDQNLEPSGKLDSRSLIGLGLGPRHDQAGPPSPSSQPAQSSP